VDKAKIEVIEQLPPPTNGKGIHSFLGHAGFYQRSIQIFSQIAQPLMHLLAKEVVFIFMKECLHEVPHFEEGTLFLRLLYNLMTGIYHLRSCVMLLIMLLEQCSASQSVRSIMLYPMQARL
jgi:hypothetical protein